MTVLANYEVVYIEAVDDEVAVCDHGRAGANCEIDCTHVAVVAKDDDVASAAGGDAALQARLQACRDLIVNQPFTAKMEASNISLLISSTFYMALGLAIAGVTIRCKTAATGL